MKTAVIAGATGLTGSQLLTKLLAADRYERVVALSRRDLSITHSKLHTVITDFRDLDRSLAGVFPADVSCCLGTTMARAGSREKFYEVDYRYPVALAMATHRLGAKQFLLVSAMGADPASRIYYNRVKGEVETAIRAIDFECIHIFRPSLLLGPRKEKRVGEDAAKMFFKVFGFAVPGKYKAIDSGRMASAMLFYASKDQRGTFIHESQRLRDLDI